MAHAGDPHQTAPNQTVVGRAPPTAATSVAVTMIRFRDALLSSPVPSDRRRRVLALDTLLAVGVLVLTGGTLVSVPAAEADHRVATVLSLVAGAALVARRLYPLASGLVVAVTGLVTLAILLTDGRPLFTGGLAPAVQIFGIVSLMSLYALTCYSSALWSRIALVATLLAAVAVTVLWEGREATDWYAAAFGAAIASALVVGVWSMGRVRRARLHELEALAQRNRALEAERAGAAERAATQERTRIAREMHDIVAHSLSAVIAQADGGRYAARSDPAAGIAALETISATSRTALSNMRALLGVLREDSPRDTAAPRGTADLEALVTDARAAGAEVSLTERGRPRPLPSGLDLTVYRIVQEALTNVRVHAPAGARTRVDLGWDDDELLVSIEDRHGSDAPTGPRPPTVTVPTGGRGILGMRERADLHGGTLEARPTATGFRVTARLPLPARADTPSEETP